MSIARESMVDYMDCRVDGGLQGGLNGGVQCGYKVRQIALQWQWMP